jgi:AraC-like DNA-binding protein
LPPGHDIPRHRHLGAYAIVVVEGSFEQTNYAGRLIARTGDILVQPTLDCHANTMISNGARILRLPWPLEQGVGGAKSLRDLDEIIRLAERDYVAATQMAFKEVSEGGLRRGEIRDWPDLLAVELVSARFTSIMEWSDAQGLARETVSRGFSRAFDVSPATFRTEMRARQAWLRCVTTRERFADIAAETGFADHAHMTRHVRAFTGAPPKFWRLALHARLMARDESSPDRSSPVT